MILFWIRELAGWVLLLAGLCLIGLAVSMLSDLEDPRVVESIVLTIASLGLLKAGVLLIRISTAARLSRRD